MSRSVDLDAFGRADDWSPVRAVVAGFGVSGFAAADNLVHVGAQVTVLDESDAGDRAEKGTLLEVLGADVRLAPGATAELPDDVDVLVTSPGWSPSAPLLAQARARGIPIWGEVELAWRLRDLERPAPWIAVTGTNGKTSTVQMLEAMLRAAGLRAVACGNIGLPIVQAVMDPEPYDVLAVELSSFQLHYTSSMSAESAAVLNVADDHLDWYADMAAYVADKGRIYSQVQRACVYNVADPVTEQLVRDADVVEGARAIGFTLGMPQVGMVGLVDEVLADRAFVEDRANTAAELGTLDDLADPDSGAPPAPHVVANALAAAALARAHGVAPAAVREGLRSWRPDAHRIAVVARQGGVTWVDDSKATNPHAAASSLAAYESVVWIAGGLAKGADFEELVRTRRDRMRAVVLLGRDRHVIAAALGRHAPDVPVIEVGDGETEPMDRAVEAAAGIAGDGDTVLLAPGCASFDQFTDYAARGDAFAAAVRRRTG
ncbi:UDP-N-acetylmuramoyl-L-alanine--D-glutamate ligase [Nocardioides massiliensis]|uniref:UDP-N-acetylmuramoylalanine--D-glutamate ligase n=1 Tax=Nocardioides massiliensis TaxID=1325935 RepID=A0ABT9NSV9_9ACTN|nr:UDP-N-acetylmuramoyl-L-alanine--D-glutamate ligase [Nocardioides massiliensis]MDP9823510.1 UDP-N-acetylmuramoylalanine--D-glutamate ligase [Nocardioides massiliensis]